MSAEVVRALALGHMRLDRLRRLARRDPEIAVTDLLVELGQAVGVCPGKKAFIASAAGIADGLATL